MGLLDQFNMSPDQTQGLLAAASQILQQSGDPRRPFGVGQAMGVGTESYQGSMQAALRRKQEEDQAKQLAQMRALQIQEAQGGLADHQRARDEADRLRQFYLKQRVPGAAQEGVATPMPSGQSAAGMMGSMIDAGGALPTTTAQAPTAPASPARSALSGPFEQRMAMAQQLRSQGFHAEADAQEAAALKFKPKYSSTPQKMTQDGKLGLYQLSEDGSPPLALSQGVAPEMVQMSLGGSTAWTDKNAVKPGQTYKHTMSPDAAARLNFDREQAAGGDASAFTAQAIQNAAARYNLDGTLPPMGMGKSGSAGRAAILNEAARQKDGIDPTQQRLDQLGAKGDAATRNAAVRSFAVGKDGKDVQAANTALNHLDTIEQLSKALKNGNVKLFNTIANHLAAETGNPAPTSLAAAISMVAPEVSKSVIGAAGGQEERATFAKNFNPNGSPDQALDGIRNIKELMGGRLTESERTYNRTTKRADFRDTMLSPAAQRVLDARKSGEAAHTPQAAPTMSAMPTPNASNRGRTIKNNDTGKRYTSNGVQWIEVK